MDYNKEAARKKLEFLNAKRDVDISLFTNKARDDVQAARNKLEQEQSKLDATPRIRNGKHNQAYGAQLNIRDAAKEEVARAEQAYSKAENDASKNRRLNQIEAKREAERTAAYDAQTARAEQEKATFLNSAKNRWLEAGGDDYHFAQHADKMWTDEMIRRTSTIQSSNAVEQIKSKVRGFL